MGLSGDPHDRFGELGLGYIAYMADAGTLSVVTVAVRLGAAAGFGAVIGLERELDGHDAGLRTHLLLALGSALFGAMSVGAFGEFITSRNATNVTFDPSRVASYVVAGVGFLGGGAILKRADRVKGLTTASSLWVVSAIGLASGLGFWSGALIATAIAGLALVAEAPVRRMVNSRLGRHVRDDRSGESDGHSTKSEAV